MKGQLIREKKERLPQEDKSTPRQIIIGRNKIITDNSIPNPGNLKKLLNITNNITIEIQNKKIYLSSKGYQDILNYYFPQENHKYLYSPSLEEELYQTIKKYNELTEVINIPNIKKVKSFDISTIKKYVKENHKFIIFETPNSKKILIQKEEALLFTFTNKPQFDNIVLPEIMNEYIKHHSIEHEMKNFVLNKAFYQCNNNFYILNFSSENLENNIAYLHKLADKQEYQINLAKDFETTIENDIIDQPSTLNRRKSYNYGYVNILLISIILSIITIIICLIKR